METPNTNLENKEPPKTSIKIEDIIIGEATPEVKYTREELIRIFKWANDQLTNIEETIKPKSKV